MIHLTMQTGHACDVPRPEEAALDALRPLVADGGGDIGLVAPTCAGVALRMCGRPWSGAASWDVSRGGTVIALCVLCAAEGARESAWRAIEGTYLRLSDQRPDLYAPGACPAMPASLPWLATLLLPSAAACPDVLPWLADFDQCVAHAALGMVAHG